MMTEFSAENRSESNIRCNAPNLNLSQRTETQATILVDLS